LPVYLHAGIFGLPGGLNTPIKTGLVIASKPIIFSIKEARTQIGTEPTRQARNQKLNTGGHFLTGGQNFFFSSKIFAGFFFG